MVIDTGRFDATFVEKGECWLRQTTPNSSCMFRALIGGITAGTDPTSTAHEPLNFNAMIPGVTFTDGGVMWVSEGYIQDYKPLGHSYNVGDRMMIDAAERRCKV
jgi:hypothetical protein